MSSFHEKLASSLKVLRKRQRGGRRVFRAEEFSRLHRERLVGSGFLMEAIKGWVVSSGPDCRPGDSTPWYASFWEFCARYCEERFGKTWYLSPEQSLLVHAEQMVIPTQALIYSPAGSNNKIALPFGTSLYDLKDSRRPGRADLIVREGLRMFTVPAALVRVGEGFFERHSVEAGLGLKSLRGDATEVLRLLLDGGHSVVAGRLAGAFRRVGDAEAAEQITATMKAAGFVVRETDPFGGQASMPALRENVSPLVNRMRVMWQSMRGEVMACFPLAPGKVRSKAAYMRSIDKLYRSDAYHSLSIEGYNVSPALIERVRTGNWNPEQTPEDRRNRDALAARGYWQAFQAVQASIVQILNGENGGQVAKARHREWYRELFQPCVAAGLIPAGALAGYRNDAVYLRSSRYVPPRWESVREAMPALFELLAEEPDAGVRAVLGHWMFGYVHPYPDGNGRMARFLMNAMLASGGYPWTVIRVEARSRYLAALESASVDGDIRPFAGFIGELVQQGINLPKGFEVELGLPVVR